MKCSNCGAIIEEGNSVCPKCGSERPIKVQRIAVKENVENSALKKKKTKYGTIIIFLCLLISLFANIILVIYYGKSSGKDESYKNVYYNGYQLTVDSDWNNDTGNDLLNLYDNNKTWGASIEFVDGVLYDDFLNKTDSFTNNMKLLDYTFTSTSSIKIENTNNLLFKGRYKDYLTYVIVTKYNKDAVILTKILFTGEVQDTVVDELLHTLANVKGDTSLKFNEEGFDFKSIRNIVDKTVN